MYLVLNTTKKKVYIKYLDLWIEPRKARDLDAFSNADPRKNQEIKSLIKNNKIRLMKDASVQHETVFEKHHRELNESDSKDTEVEESIEQQYDKTENQVNKNNLNLEDSNISSLEKKLTKNRYRQR